MFNRITGLSCLVSSWSSLLIHLRFEFLKSFMLDSSLSNITVEAWHKESAPQIWFWFNTCFANPVPFLFPSISDQVFQEEAWNQLDQKAPGWVGENLRCAMASRKSGESSEGWATPTGLSSTKPRCTFDHSSMHGRRSIVIFAVPWLSIHRQVCLEDMCSCWKLTGWV